MENPIKMDDWGVPLFSETSIWGVVFFGTYDGSQSCNKFCLRNFGLGVCELQHFAENTVDGGWSC